MFTAVFLIITKKWKQPKYVLTDKQSIAHIYITYTYLYKGILFSHEKIEVLIYGMR